MDKESVAQSLDVKNEQLHKWRKIVVRFISEVREALTALRAFRKRINSRPALRKKVDKLLNEYKAYLLNLEKSISRYNADELKVCADKLNTSSLYVLNHLSRWEGDLNFPLDAVNKKLYELREVLSCLLSRGSDFLEMIKLRGKSSDTYALQEYSNYLSSVGESIEGASITYLEDFVVIVNEFFIELFDNLFGRKETVFYFI